jgi:uncharacterized membrane protein
MEEIYPIIRAIHVLSGSLWIGEVVVINFILIPVLSKYRGETKKQFLISVFPRIFNLASVLSATASITGVYLIYYVTQGNLSRLTQGRWGISILIGGCLGILLTLFHFFMENRLARKIGLGKQGDHEKLEDVHLKLKIIPRLGLIVILSIFLLMINASHGL